MTPSSRTLDLQGDVQRLRGLAAPAIHIQGVGSDDLTEDVLASVYERLAAVSHALDEEKFNGVRLANAVVSLAENLKRPTRSGAAEAAYYQHLIDAILDLTK